MFEYNPCHWQAEPGMIVEVISPGYCDKNALLRPARVRVSQ